MRFEPLRPGLSFDHQEFARLAAELERQLGWLAAVWILGYAVIATAILCLILGT